MPTLEELFNDKKQEGVSLNNLFEKKKEINNENESVDLKSLFKKNVLEGSVIDGGSIEEKKNISDVLPEIWDDFKENLLNSFKQSFKKGYGIETDIHATKDNKFICFHDFTLKRIFKKNLSVKNLNYSKIKDLSKTFTQVCKKLCDENKKILETLENIEPKNNES